MRIASVTELFVQLANERLCFRDRDRVRRICSLFEGYKYQLVTAHFVTEYFVVFQCSGEQQLTLSQNNELCHGL